MALLYVGGYQKNGFIEGLTGAMKEEPLIANGKVRAYECLPEAEGVVFVGIQHRVFPSTQEYFDFLNSVVVAGLYVASVLEEGESLPESNMGIDRLIRTSQDKTLTSIARELDQFFSQG